MLNEEALKALQGVKDELKSELTTDVEKSRTEMAGAITKEVIAKVEESMKNIKKPSDTKTQGQEDMVKYFHAKFNKDIKGQSSDDLKLGRKYFEDVETKDLDTATATAGEELVPEYFGNEVLRVAEKVGVARQNSRVITLPGKTFTLPTMGSAVAYRTDEKAAITAGTITTGNLTFTAKKVAGMVIATRECVEDANVDVISDCSIIGRVSCKTRRPMGIFRYYWYRGYF